MLGFLSALFRGAKADTPSGSTAVTASAPRSKRSSGRREPPIEIDWSHAQYIPLPPSPPTWEVDGCDEFGREYSDSRLHPIFLAGYKNQNTKVVKLAAGLEPGLLQGSVAAAVAKAYSKLIDQRVKRGHLAAAATLSAELFERMPDNVKDEDRRRFNRILAAMDKAGKKHVHSAVDVASRASMPLFTLSEDAPWALVGEKKLPSDQRPDPAFDVVAIDAKGFWLLNLLATTADSAVQSVLRRVDRDGVAVGDKALHHFPFHMSANATGSRIALVDSAGVLYVYDAQLQLVATANLLQDPRVLEHLRTFNKNYSGQLISQLRAVDAAPEGGAYLFAFADEVWCCTPQGVAIWGVAVPLREGWKRVVGRSERFGVSRDVQDALRLFDLSLPVSPEDIKRKYRKLAQVHHPDRNAGDPGATAKMQSLNKAIETLTGLDPTTLGWEESDDTFFARTAPDVVFEVEGLLVELACFGGNPQDSVCVATFAVDGGAYLATSTGKVVRVSSTGRPEVVYDIGGYASEIIDLGRYTYILTATRLYVIENKRLVALLDIFRRGRLLVSHTGFGLMSGKRLQWFTHAGVKVGELTTRDPIRAIHATGGAAIVQTRQHQIEVQGLCI